MSDRPFAHLHCHTHYSLLDGASKIPDLIKKVKELGMNSCAITDHGNLYGALEFYTKAKDAGVNPILGYEAYIAPGARTDRTAARMKDASFHLTLLAMNRQGFQNLVKLSSKAFLEGYYYRPRIDKEILAQHHEGIICLSGCASSELSRLLLAEEKEKAESLVHWFSNLFGDRFYLEIQDGGVEIQQSCAEATIDLANRMGFPLVATNDAHYLCQTDSAMHDVLLCVNTKSQRSDEKRMKIDTDQLFIRSPEQMYAAFPKQAEAVARSQEIANRVDINLDLKTRHFPVFAPPPGKTDIQHLKEVALEGLKWRYGAEPEQKYHDRLNFELGVIEKMGFASYFLIVWDFARFARDKGIPCSARGSACGAIVAFVLGLSDVCPIKYDLLFERFLDPNRTEAPDIDIDFCQERRELVIQYVKEKYGYANVAQIGTFGTLKAKAAIRDVCRALGVDLKRADQIAKMVPEELNIKLKDAIEKSPELKAEYERDEQIKEVLDFSMALEGLAKSAGTHAAGVVIADRPLDEYVPLQKITGKDDILTQWTEVEKAGLLKMDFLGLRNLTILDRAVKNVKRHRGVDIVPKDLPLDDKPTFALLQRGESKGIFQLESGGMRDLLTKMKPDKFEDIIATSALYRPGPLEGGMVTTYVECKNGRQAVAKIHPIVDPVLAETYGVMVYQEQVMRILNRLGGIELASSYKCIKAISKKKLDDIAKYKGEFIEGAKSNGMSEEQATELFGLIDKFAGYGFNKSHSTAYGAIAYQTAYLKAHYPGEFMAALLSCEMESSERIAEHADDARRMGLDLLPPNVNISDVEFTVVEEVVDEKVTKGQGASTKGKKKPTGQSLEPRARGNEAGTNDQGLMTKDSSQPNVGLTLSHSPDTSSPQRLFRKIAFGMGAIRGVGDAPVRAIMEERQKNGPFKDIFDLTERIDPKVLQKGSLEMLIKAGALDTFGPNRAQHLAAVDRAAQAAANKFRDKAKGQRSLFGGPPKAGAEPLADLDVTLPPLEDMPHSQKLALEKEVLGFYLTSHPLTEFGAQLGAYTQHQIKDLRDMEDGKEVFLGGMIGAIKPAATKKPSRNGNSKYVNFDLEDSTGVVRCIMWPDDFANHGEKVKKEAIVLIRGRIDAKSREPNIIINKLMTLEQAEKEFTKRLLVKFKRGYHTGDEMKRVRDALFRYPGKTPVVLVLETWEETANSNGNGPDRNGDPHDHAHGAGTATRTPLKCLLTMGTTVAAGADLKRELSMLLGSDGFRFEAGSATSAGGPPPDNY
ncbi:MAG: DNA polymerase III subunit alpha [Planctomycetota bacterium]|nr:MAG: DNA polymerase III subunit alpha [Planctomycetota bacterium]